MTETLIHIPLQQAYLCCDETCNAIGNDPHRCPACAGTAVMGLSAILNRSEPPTPIERELSL